MQASKQAKQLRTPLHMQMVSVLLLWCFGTAAAATLHVQNNSAANCVPSAALHSMSKHQCMQQVSMRAICPSDSTASLPQQQPLCSTALLTKQCNCVKYQAFACQIATCHIDFLIQHLQEPSNRSQVLHIRCSSNAAHSLVRTICTFAATATTLPALHC
jgi:hypothetical protein